MNRVSTLGILVITVAILVVASISHAMPAPRTGTLVPPLALDIQVVAVPLVVAQDMPSMRDLVPSADRKEEPAPPPSPEKPSQTKPAQPLPEPDTTDRKVMGYIALVGGIGGTAIGTGLAYGSINGGRRVGEGGMGIALWGIVAGFVITELSVVLGTYGVWAVSEAYGDEAAHELTATSGNAKTFEAESYYKTAKYAAIIGLVSLGVAAAIGGTAAGVCSSKSSNNDTCELFMFPGAYFLEIGLASEMMALIDFAIAESKEHSMLGASTSYTDRVGFALMPSRDGLTAGIGMRF